MTDPDDRPALWILQYVVPELLGLLLAAGLALLLTGCVRPRVVGPYEVTWMQEAANGEEAQAWVYRLYVTPSGQVTAAAPVTLAGVVCIGQGTTDCTAPLPSAADGAVSPGASSQLTAARDATAPEGPPSQAFVVPMPGTGCTWEEIDYDQGDRVVEPANKQRLQGKIDALETAGFNVVQVAQQAPNRFQITARCVGIGNVTRRGSTP